MQRINRLCTLIIVSIGLVLGSFAADAEPNPSIEQFIGRFRADRQALTNFYETIRPSTFYDERLNALYSDWLDKLGPFNFDSLDQQGRIDFLMFRDSLQHERAVIARQLGKFKSIEPLIPFRVRQVHRQRPGLRHRLQLLARPPPTRFQTRMSGRRKPRIGRSNGHRAAATV